MSIAWAGPAHALEPRLLMASGAVDVAVVTDLDAAVSGRRSDWLGIATAPSQQTLRRSDLADGLAKTVGAADCVAFAGGLPQSFALCARVGGIVAAVREATGRRYLRDAVAIVGSGPEAWCALAALAQLKASISIPTGDATVGALARRMGIDVAAGREGLVYDAHAPRLEEPGAHGESPLVDRSAILLHSVAAQLRIFTAREPDTDAMRACACG